MFERHDQKLIIFVFKGHFHQLLPIVFWSVEIYKEYDSLYILEKNEKNLSFLHLWPFSWAMPTVLGSRGEL
jgi:hypothetical protein